MSNFHVAIIGAGLSGLALALALHKHSIPCTLYEARPAPLDTGGGLMLTPNGLKALQGVGIYDSLVDEAFSFDNIYLQLGPTGAILESIEYGNVPRYGMRALRVFRYTVLERLLAKVRSLGIPIHFNRKFSHVVEETEDGVTWGFEDGNTERASILVGADGIHSTVRKYVAPGIEPTFTGFVTLVAAVPTAQLGLPANDIEHLNDPNNKYPMPTGIVVPQLGAFVMLPQSKNGEELCITVMRPFPEEPETWKSLNDDKDRMRAMFRENVEKFPEIVQNAVREIPGENLFVWPGYQIPLLEHWTSVNNSSAGGKGRVVILGDSAHALPPSSGQGVNQAFEDVYSFANVLGKLSGDAKSAEKLRNALKGWQAWRQERIDGVLRLNKQMELRRLPAAVKKEKGIDADPESLKQSMNEAYDKLFSVDFEKVVGGNA